MTTPLDMPYPAHGRSSSPRETAAFNATYGTGNMTTPLDVRQNDPTTLFFILPCRSDTPLRFGLTSEAP
jgi:hypothetical protein